jgi:hypothetical protein
MCANCTDLVTMHNMHTSIDKLKIKMKQEIIVNSSRKHVAKVTKPKRPISASPDQITRQLSFIVWVVIKPCMSLN